MSSAIGALREITMKDMKASLVFLAFGLRVLAQKKQRLDNAKILYGWSKDLCTVLRCLDGPGSRVKIRPT